MIQMDSGLETPDEDFFRPEAIVVRLLLSLGGLSQARLAELTRILQNTISLYSRGQLVPSPETLQQLADAAGWSLPLLHQVATVLVRFRDLPLALGPLRLESPAAEVGRQVAILVEGSLLELGLLLRKERPEHPQIDSPAADDAIAEDLWARMADLDDRQRRVLIDFFAAFHQPSLALRLEKESERLGPEHPADAAGLGRLARHVEALCGRLALRLSRT